MNNPDRWSFDIACAHLFYLMTSDSYSRYIRSSHYKDLLETAKRKLVKPSLQFQSYLLPSYKVIIYMRILPQCILDIKGSSFSIECFPMQLLRLCHKLRKHGYQDS
eukprot:UN00303